MKGILVQVSKNIVGAFLIGLRLLEIVLRKDFSDATNIWYHPKKHFTFRESNFTPV